MHGLIQAFSRTNRILNSIKTFGNIVCFRNLAKRVDEAIALFGDKDAGGIVLMKSYDHYYHGYIDDDGTKHPGFTQIVQELETKYPLSTSDIVGEQNKKDFVKLFGVFLRLRNILSSFDEFEGNEILSERDLQDYMSRYQDTYQWIKDHKDEHDSTDVTDDIVYEIELMKQIEINIDYILLLVAKYKDSHCQDKEVLVSIRKAVDSSSSLRSKKELIEGFISGLNDIDDVITGWQNYVSEEKEKALVEIIESEKLKPEETRRFIEDSFELGEIKTTGTDIDKLLPPVSRFGGGNRAKKKETVIEKLKAFFEKFFGIVTNKFRTGETKETVDYNPGSIKTDDLKVAESTHGFNK